MPDRPVLDKVNVIVRDMPAMLAFYRLLGLDIPDFDPTWDEHHRSASAGDGLDFDFDSQPFAQQWNRGWPTGTTGPMIGFRVAGDRRSTRRSNG